MTTTGPEALPDERIPVAGLHAPVQIALDRWGVPHIRAENVRDLFFGQGFNAARDRLWQIDLWRKRGLGRLAADFGPGFLAQDRAARLFLYRGDMAAEWNAYGPDARAICEAFVDGINAYIGLTETEPDRLPPEFTALGTQPLRWHVDDVVRIRTHGPMRNALSEVLRATVVFRADAATDLLRMNLEPPVSALPADGFDLGSLPSGILDVYKLAIAPVVFSRDRLEARSSEAWAWTEVTPLGQVLRSSSAQGSNNWAVAGGQTATGRPILANDPHRLHSVPSLRYLVHLTAPDLDVIGAGEPSFPGVAIGHNGQAAFGLTLFLGPDQEDVYVYDTQPENPSRYRHGSGWEAMRVIEETFQVKGAEPHTRALKFTRHGPVVYEDAGRRRAFAIRTVWSEPGAAPYGGSLAAMRSRTFDQFRGAMRSWGVPAVNHVYADAAGDIGWVAAGLTPLRRNWNGLLPVPGDGRYEWDGFLDPDLLPAVLNPPAGFVASANAMNLPADWPRRDRPMGYEWDDPSRARRIKEMLAADPRHSIEAACALQTDVVSLPARRLCALLRAIRSEDGNVSRALELLDAWDHRLAADSAPAALFEVWWNNHLRPTIISRLVPQPEVRRLILPGDLESTLIAIEDSSGPLSAQRDAILAATLGEAFRHSWNLMGPDTRQWAWGRLHGVRFEHALSGLGGEPGTHALDIGPLPLGGSESTVMKAAYRPSDFQVVLGPSVRIVVDVGDWDRSVWINAPGQSGDLRSVHYADLAPLWAKGEYVPMTYSAGAVEAAVDRRIVLTPA